MRSCAERHKKREFHHEAELSLLQISAVFSAGWILAPNWWRVNVKWNGPDQNWIGATARYIQLLGHAPRLMTCDALCLLGSPLSRPGGLLENKYSSVTLNADEKNIKECWQLHYNLLTVALRCVRLTNHKRPMTVATCKIRLASGRSSSHYVSNSRSS